MFDHLPLPFDEDDLDAIDASIDDDFRALAFDLPARPGTRRG